MSFSNYCNGCGENVFKDSFSLFYPNNSIRISTAYEKLLDNIDKISIEKIEELTKDF